MPNPTSRLMGPSIVVKKWSEHGAEEDQLYIPKFLITLSVDRNTDKWISKVYNRSSGDGSVALYTSIEVTGELAAYQLASNYIENFLFGIDEIP